MKCPVIALASALLFAAACSKAKAPAPSGGAGQAPRGLPPSGEGADLPSGANPHAGGGDPANPHAGMNMDNPHAGGGAEGPTAAIDPSMVLEGTIDIAPALAAQVKEGDILFLSVKAYDPATGVVQSFPMAVDRADLGGTMPLPFKITGANAMVQGLAFSGPVMVIARVDRDGEARTKGKGDIEGSVKATIPEKEIKLVLDTPLEDPPAGEGPSVPAPSGNLPPGHP